MLDKLEAIIKENKDTIEERFESEFEGIRLGLRYSAFWEKVFKQKIHHTAG
ncbi:hypothetical protein [Paenibacillus sp. FSL R5-0923]|uniref:hypothetical protein n=1 Tax=Paenibacillus sp. FSL R5-0923 TaxID=2921666 RepID=UPI0030F7D382